ncbi:MAG: phosphoribosylamine--glycine ligase [Desulfobacterales bacterium]|nr:phosphoribosylamine--glycine ligase [Desulfobacterales bacterium]
MKVFVVGSGGREHALIWKIKKSCRNVQMFCAPGNAGIADIAECIPIESDNINALCDFAKENQIDLTVVGPEAPLVSGIVDVFEQNQLRIFGPSQKAAILEGSKSFAKAFMQRHHIPTAKGCFFDRLDLALDYVKTHAVPMVIKADGLAAGKGVFVCKTLSEAENALHQLMEEKQFGKAGERVVIEQCLIGEEVSFLVLTDGKTVLPLPTSQDHKQIFDDDQGPNTGGMGAYSPAPIVDNYLHRQIMKQVMIPTIKGMASEGCMYKGILYAGLMIQKEKINVLEFNVRFGDPEAQPILMRMQSDLIPLMDAVIDGTLDQCDLKIDTRPSVCVVMASKGYPGTYRKNLSISGLHHLTTMSDVIAFHSGTKKEDEKQEIMAVGGRVLGITALADTMPQAIQTAYQAVNHIHWEEAYYRKDIGQKALKRLSMQPMVGIVMGSDSDISVMDHAISIFKQFEIPYEITVASAHRTPDKAAHYAASAQQRGIKAIIAGAGHAAHLAGAIAARTNVPVIGVPIDSSALKGMDALLSTVQMPPGIPVATMAIGNSGATNAAIFAIQILSLENKSIETKLIQYREKMQASVEAKSKQFELI